MVESALQTSQGIKFNLSIPSKFCLQLVFVIGLIFADPKYHHPKCGMYRAQMELHRPDHVIAPL